MNFTRKKIKFDPEDLCLTGNFENIEENCHNFKLSPIEMVLFFCR